MQITITADGKTKPHVDLNGANPLHAAEVCAQVVNGLCAFVRAEAARAQEKSDRAPILVPGGLVPPPGNEN